MNVRYYTFKLFFFVFMNLRVIQDKYSIIIIIIIIIIICCGKFAICFRFHQQLFHFVFLSHSDILLIMLFSLRTVCKCSCIYNNYSPKWRWLVLDIYRGRESGEVNIQY